MHTRSKLALIEIGAALIMAAAGMAAAVGSASAGRYSISHGELLQFRWSALRLQVVGITGAECPVTLESSLHNRTFTKTVSTLLGYVTRASLGRCITGSATILSETLPWHIQYGGFNEALPNPRPIINIIGLAFRINNAITGSCLMRSTTTEPFVGIIEPTYPFGGGNGIAERLKLDESRRIECPGVGRSNVAGTALITEATGTRNALLQLI